MLHAWVLTTDLGYASKAIVFVGEFVSTWGRDRTDTVLLPLVFETNASTYSATQAR